MISADFAPNESIKDAAAGLWMSVRFLQWRKGEYTAKVKARLKRMFPNHVPFLYFTGRAALYKLLQTYPFIKPGDEILVLGFTCEAVVLPIRALGFTPVFVDMDRETYSMDPRSATAKISPRTRAIIIQHTFGITPLRDELIALAKRHDLLIIEDLAHGFDRSLFAKDKANTVKLLSFGRSKSVSAVFGGALMIPDTRAHAKLIRRINDSQKSLPYPSAFQTWQLLSYKSLAYIIKKTYSLGNFGKALHAVLRGLKFIPNELSQKERSGTFDDSVVKAFPNAFAYLLIKQFKESDRVYQNRLQACYLYNSFFKVPNTKYAHLTRYPLLVTNRDDVVKALKKKQIYVGKWYHNPQSQPGECPVTDEICSLIINLPTNITEQDAKTVAKAILALQPA